jgi:NifU-like N terminal domain
MTADLLAPEVRRLFGDLAHAGTLSAISGVISGEAGRQQRGTRVRFHLQLDGARIMAVRYQTYGCPHTLAVCEWLSRQLETVGKASLGSPADWCRALGVPIVKLGRMLVIEDALNAALQQIPAAS